MTTESRITLSPGSRTMKASRQMASSVSASGSLKRHVPVPTLIKSLKGPVAKFSSTSSSDSSSGKTSLNGGKAISDRKTSQGKKDAPADAKVSSSQSSAESTGTGFEASNDLSSECIEPVETKGNIDMAEPSLLNPELQLKDLDVVHSNLAVSWFNVDDREFDDFLKTKADQDPHTTDSETQHLLYVAPEAAASPDSLLESINDGYVDEFDGAIGRVYSMSTPLQEKIYEDGKVIVDVEEFRLEAPDVRDCSEGMDDCHKYRDGPTAREASEGKSEVKLACENLVREWVRMARHGVDAFRGWGATEILLSTTLLVLVAVVFCVERLMEGEFGMLPPPT